MVYREHDEGAFEDNDVERDDADKWQDAAADVWNKGKAEPKKDEVQYTSKVEKASSADDAATAFKVEKDDAGLHFRITDANGKQTTIKKSDGISNRIASAEIRGRDGEVTGKIEDGKFTFKDAKGKEFTKELDRADLHEKTGTIILKFKDGTITHMRGDGALTDYDAQGRPTTMRDANGTIWNYDYEHSPADDPRKPSEITKQKAGEEQLKFKLDPKTGNYKGYVGLMEKPIESSSSLGAGFVDKLGVGVTIPLDSLFKIDVSVT